MNDMLDDFQLLRAYANENSDDAFRELVARHGGMVQGVALRAVGPNLADEVTQNTFLLLARKARSMKANVVLAGWLHRAARFIAMETLRREKRKARIPEELAIAEKATATFDDLAPVLDDALERLKEEDRESIVLRFLEGRSFAEVGAAMSTSEAAAKMRVGRALEKLRATFARQGIALSVTALVATLSSQAATAIPNGIATVVLAKAAAKSAGVSIGEVLRELFFMKKIKMAVIVGGAMLLVVSVVTPMALGPKAVVNSFHPMAGEWAGSMQIEQNGSKVTQAVELLVATSNEGRKAEITMKVSGGQVYNFSHEIDATGRRVTTSDDPKLNVNTGVGKVTDSASGAEWSATVLTPHRSGYSECIWTVRGDELKISRHDQFRKYFVHRFNQYSTMILKKKAEARAGL